MPVDVSRHGRVLRIALNRPEKRNALNAALCAHLASALEQDAGAIVLTGNGSAFCAGMDLHDTDAPGMAELHERLFTTIDRMRKPVIAAVRGAALGGGTGLVANAHIAIAAPDARFGLTEIRIGLWPVLIFRAMVLAVGERRATELSLTGRVFGATEALAYGLITEISEDPEARALELATAIAQHSPVAISAGLEYASGIRGRDWAEAGKAGQAMRDRLLASPDFAEGVKAFFEKRQPQWPSISTI